MDEKKLGETFAAWRTELAALHLPRWEELPELELYMDQVIALMEKYLRPFSDGDEANRLITPSMINNYVKQGVLPPPQKKKYTREHLACLVILCILKQTLSIPDVLELIEAQKRRIGLPALLNLFCERYEAVLADNLAYAEYAVSRKGGCEVGALPLHLAAHAHAGQRIAQKTLALARAEASEPPAAEPPAPAKPSGKGEKPDKADKNAKPDKGDKAGAKKTPPADAAPGE